jgi:hypothetical protein
VSPIQASQNLESRAVHTDRVKTNQVLAIPSGLLVLFYSAQAKDAAAMENSKIFGKGGGVVRDETCG